MGGGKPGLLLCVSVQQMMESKEQEEGLGLGGPVDPVQYFCVRGAFMLLGQ